MTVMDGHMSLEIEPNVVLALSIAIISERDRNEKTFLILSSSSSVIFVAKIIANR